MNEHDRRETSTAAALVDVDAHVPGLNESTLEPANLHGRVGETIDGRQDADHRRDSLRSEDCGILWEHLVLDALIASATDRLHFWRDKQQREVDFVVPGRRSSVTLLEAKATRTPAPAMGRPLLAL